jgi:predicted nucleic acid-binding protein
MPKALLDTDILSEYLKGHHPIMIARAADYAREHGIFTFTSVTVHEIVYGLEVKGASAQLQKALRWLNQNEEITPTAADYLQAAIIKASAGKQGSMVELPDCLIAAVATRLRMPLVTAILKIFRRSNEQTSSFVSRTGAIHKVQ